RPIAQGIGAELIVRAEPLERERARKQLHRRRRQHLLARVVGVECVAARQRYHHPAPHSAPYLPREIGERRREVVRAARRTVPDGRDCWGPVAIWSSDATS